MTMDFMERELHVRLDHQADGSDIMKLTFFYEKHWHEMQRPRNECVQKTLSRMAKTIAKTHKSKNKTKRAKNLHASQGNSTPGAQEEKDDPADCRLLHNGQILAAKTLSNSDFQTGMVVQLNESQWTVVVNPPTISHLASFPRSHYTLGYPIVPIVSIEYASHFHCQWLHETSASSGQYEVVSQELVFTPTLESVHRRIKLVATPYRDDPADSHSLQPQPQPHHTRVFGRPVVFYLSQSVRPPSPNGARPRTLQLREDFYRSISPALPTSYAFRVMTYNVLSEGYALKDQASNPLYHYCDAAYLELEYRGQLIAQELLASHADIIALQECDRKLFISYLLPLLGQAGYAGHFTNKVSMVQEGCALFLRRQTVRLERWIDLPYKHILQPQRSTAARLLYAQRPDLQDVLGGKLGTIAQIAVVTLVPPETSPTLPPPPSSSRGDKVLCIANTHLFYHPQASYLRLLQAHALTDYLAHSLLPSLQSAETHPSGVDDPIDPRYLHDEHRVATSLLPPCPASLPFAADLPDLSRWTLVAPRPQTAVVILGDLNSTPSSPAYAFLRHGRVSAASLARVWAELAAFAWGKADDSAEDDCVQGASRACPRPRPGDEDEGPIPAHSLVHSLGLADTCQTWPDDVVTNFVPGFHERLDHILASDGVDVVRVGPMPGRDVLEEDVALPSSAFPSDHVSVVVDLAWR